MKRIEICGNIASGKTTLCQNLVSKGCYPILENFQDNPFLEKFYENPQKFSFETEVTFLLQHYHLIKLQRKRPLNACDYSLFLDMAYADINLTGNRYKIFSDIVQDLQNEIGLPLQIIHLICPEDILIERIIGRGRDTETSITVDYLKALTRAISLRLKKISNQIPVLSIDSHTINFVKGIKKNHAFDSVIKTP